MASTKPTIILVHGAWHTPLHLSALRRHLTDSGYQVITPHLPSCNLEADPGDALAEDASTVAQSIKSVTGRSDDVVLVMHSYGGTAGSEGIGAYLSSNDHTSAPKGKILKLVFLSALILNKGQSAASQNIVTSEDQSTPPPQITPEGIILPARADDKVARDVTRARLFNETPDDLAEHAMSTLTGFAMSAYVTPAQYQGWSEAGVPVQYVVCGKDQAWLPAKQRECVERMREAGVEVGVVEKEEWDHSPYLAHASEVAEIVVDAIQSKE